MSAPDTYAMREKMLQEDQKTRSHLKVAAGAQQFDIRRNKTAVGRRSTFAQSRNYHRSDISAGKELITNHTKLKIHMSLYLTSFSFPNMDIIHINCYA